MVDTETTPVPEVAETTKAQVIHTFLSCNVSVTFNNPLDLPKDL